MVLGFIFLCIFAILKIAALFEHILTCMNNTFARCVADLKFRCPNQELLVSFTPNLVSPTDRF